VRLNHPTGRLTHQNLLDAVKATGVHLDKQVRQRDDDDDDDDDAITAMGVRGQSYSHQDIILRSYETTLGHTPAWALMDLVAVVCALAGGDHADPRAGPAQEGHHPVLPPRQAPRGHQPLRRLSINPPLYPPGPAAAPPLYPLYNSRRLAGIWSLFLGTSGVEGGGRLGASGREDEGRIVGVYSSLWLIRVVVCAWSSVASLGGRRSYL
jgi:hypothetical protein